MKDMKAVRYTNIEMDERTRCQPPKDNPPGGWSIQITFARAVQLWGLGIVSVPLALTKHGPFSESRARICVCVC